MILIRLIQAQESGILTLWKHYDYLSSLFGAKFDYRKTGLVQDLKLEDTKLAFMLIILFISISSIVFLLEIIIFFLNKLFT